MRHKLVDIYGNESVIYDFPPPPKGSKVTIQHENYVVKSLEYDYDQMVVTVSLGYETKVSTSMYESANPDNGAEIVKLNESLTKLAHRVDNLFAKDRVRTYNERKK